MMFRIIFFMLCAMGVFSVEAGAQLFLENGKESLSVSAGEHLNGSLLIHNTSSAVQNVKVYWEDFKYKPPYDGSKDFLPAGTVPGSASQWVSFAPQTFSIPALSQQYVNYTVAVPDQIQEGHYGVLFFESTSDVAKNASGVTIITRVGCLFFIEPKDKTKKAVIQDIALKTNSVTANFVNQGNVILIPHTTYYIMDSAGLVTLRGDNKKLYIPPGVGASLEIPLKKPLGQGRYTLVVNSDMEDGDVVVKEIGLAVDASGQMSIENSQD